MNLGPAVIEIEYPESDGKPRGETDLHRKWMNRICDLLSCRYRGQRHHWKCAGAPAEALGIAGPGTMPAP